MKQSTVWKKVLKKKKKKKTIQNSNDILRPQLLQYNIKGQNCPPKSGPSPEACVCLCKCSMRGGPSTAGVTQAHHGPTTSASTQPWNTARAQQLRHLTSTDGTDCQQISWCFHNTYNTLIILRKQWRQCLHDFRFRIHSLIDLTTYEMQKYY